MYRELKMTSDVNVSHECSKRMPAARKEEITSAPKGIWAAANYHCVLAKEAR